MSDTIHATITPAAASEILWDAVIVGAGPAGTAAAISLARRRAVVLLVDKSSFPRGKVCGCCLNASALNSLEALEVSRSLAKSGAVPLESLRLASAGHEATVALPTRSLCLSREALDAALVREAIDCGAHFIPAAHARLIAQGTTPLSPPGERDSESASHHRAVYLRTPQSEAILRACVILAADGLGGHFLDDEPSLTSVASTNSRMGAGTCVERAPSTYVPHVIHMACGRGGYVGLVRLEDGRLDIAAALDAGFVKRTGGPAAAVATIIDEAGFDPIDSLAAAIWRGTPKLTRRRKHLGAERLLVLGDAAGYVEPFTGEGIAWALASGITVAPVALKARETWSGEIVKHWEANTAALLDRRRRVCALVTRALRWPVVPHLAVAALQSWPRLTQPLVRAVSVG